MPLISKTFVRDLEDYLNGLKELGAVLQDFDLFICRSMNNVSKYSNHKYGRYVCEQIDFFSAVLTQQLNYTKEVT